MWAVLEMNPAEEQTDIQPAIHNTVGPLLSPFVALYTLFFITANLQA